MLAPGADSGLSPEAAAAGLASWSGTSRLAGDAAAAPGVPSPAPRSLIRAPA